MVVSPGSVAQPAAASGGEQGAAVAGVHRVAGRHGRSGGAGYAYAPDYGWLRGRLEYSQSLRQWKLRYIPIDGKTDEFGGSVKLPTSNELAAFKTGDMVSVRGSVARQPSASGSFAPQYDLASIEPVVR